LEILAQNWTNILRIYTVWANPTYLLQIHAIVRTHATRTCTTDVQFILNHIIDNPDNDAAMPPLSSHN